LAVSPQRPTLTQPPARRLGTGQRRSLALAVALTVAAGLCQVSAAGPAVRFVVAGADLASLAALVGESIESVGERLGPGATGMLQSTLGNLPELFVGVFALRSGLLELVRAALVGSILGNSLLVLGIAFLAGGLRHGPQRFDPDEPRLYGTLLLLAAAALAVPTLASRLDTPAAHHSGALSDVCAAVLLAVYACTIPVTLRRSRSDPSPAARSAATSPSGAASPAGSLVLLLVASAGAAAASDWFVAAVRPATHALGLSQAFTGLVVVALASNAVENAVGIRFALRAKPAYALSTTLASPLQVALLLTPALVLVSNAIAPTPLTLVFPPLLVAAIGLSAVVVVVVVYDGEYTWIEGAALVALYVMVAAAFWWG